MATRRSFDDSDEEEEATAIDLRSTPSAFKKAPQIAKPAPSTQSIASKRPLHQSDDASGDEEATEFLSARPASSVRSSQGDGVASSLRARGRAVPLEMEEDASSKGTLPIDKRPAVSTTTREPTEPTTAPEAIVPAALPNRTPRPLPERGSKMRGESQTGSSAGGSPKSQPRITRIFVDPDATHKKIHADDDDGASETDPGNETTDPPQPRPRPLPAAGKPPTIVALSTPSDERSDKARATEERRPRGAKTSRTSTDAISQTLEAEPADGTLIVEVPEGAVVFIDGLERGKGPSLKVKQIDRYAKHAVRIHCAGYLPWSGSVCLEGRTAAKIRPSLKKRDK